MPTQKEKTFKLVLEYDGSHFSGWQIQPNRRTVQREIESSLERVLRRPVRITAAGRTDAGVHASGQVASFFTAVDFEPGKLKYVLNSILPRDITVLDCAVMPPGFNARFDARWRTYRYTLSERKRSIGRHYAWQVKYRLSRELLEAAVQPLEGECSLEGFSRRNEEDVYSTIIFKKGWTFGENMMIFEISAVRFFHHSVRSIIGTAVDVARGKKAPDTFRTILETRDRTLTGPLAPACGLCLTHVEYEVKEP